MTDHTALQCSPEVGVDLAEQVFILIAEAADAHGASLRDCAMACGVAVKTLMVHSGQLPDDAEDEVLAAAMEDGFAQGLSIPADFVSVTMPPQH